MTTTLKCIDGANGKAAPSPDVTLRQVIARLADRAAYATGDEYTALRDMMTALKNLLAAHR